jgi:UDP-3-O-[3-hydroxymyristoyl] glucosamine N-acyltransferase
LKISELAHKLNAQCILGSEGDCELDGVGGIQDAGSGKVTFLTGANFEKFLASSKASAVILSERSDDGFPAQIIHENPHFAFAQTAQMFFRLLVGFEGVHERAFVATDAEVSASATVCPFSFVGAGAQIGDDVVIFPYAYVGEGVKIGKGSIVRPHAVLEHGCEIGERVVVHAGAVVGADGFGFAIGKDGLAKIPQTGIVVIENDVEVGSLSNVHRGAIGETRIGEGTKLDSLVHVAHNVKIGKHCLLCGQMGIAGSATIGDRAMAGGQSAINGHIHVGDHLKLGARGVITDDYQENDSVLLHGFPAIPATEHWRNQASLKRLPALKKQMRDLKKQVEDLTARLDEITK